MVKRMTSYVGRVTSAGVTPKVATLRTQVQKYDKFLRRHTTHPLTLHISDPTCSLHTNDTIRVTRYPSLSRTPSITHTVAAILSPWGVPLRSRPPVFTPEERAAARALQVAAQGGPVAEALRAGRYVLDTEGSLVRTPEGGKGWKRFGGLVGEKGKGEAETEAELETKRREEGGVFWVDGKGVRRVVGREVMERVKGKREEALGWFKKLGVRGVEEAPVDVPVESKGEQVQAAVA